MRLQYYLRHCKRHARRATAAKQVLRETPWAGRILGLGLLALHFPAGAQTQAITPIVLDQTVQGTLTSSDRLLEDGTPYDTYISTVTAPGQPYFIKVTSPDIPLIVTLFRSGPGGGLIPFQDASVFTRTQTPGFSVRSINRAVWN